jgi:hypothetical protein
MNEQNQSRPTGLTREQYHWLFQYMDDACGQSIDQLHEMAYQHFLETQSAYQTNPKVEFRVAQAIWEQIDKLVKDWSNLNPVAQPWIAGAILYFIENNDKEPDLSSPTGFEDDLEVFNSCLRFSDLDEISINLEDRDNG